MFAFFDMKEIHQWFATSKDYKVGVALYEKYGSSDFLKKFFGMANTSTSRERLAKELKLILDSKHQDKPTPPPTEKQQSERLKRSRISDAADAPKAILLAVAERKTLYKEANRLHGSLAHVSDQKLRAESANKILLNFKRIREIWKLTNFYDRNNRLPETVIIDEDWSQHNSVELNRQWLLDYKYIRDYYQDDRKKDKVDFRRERLQTIQSLLVERDAFQYANLKLPTQ